MPRLAFRNDRTRAWTKNGKGRKPLPANRNVRVSNFHALCQDCNRLYAVNESHNFVQIHRAKDNIPNLYCGGTPGEIAIWLDEGPNYIGNIHERMFAPLDESTLIPFGD